MRKRAQVGALIIFVFIAIIMGAAWFAFIGEYFTSVGELALASGSTGGYAFFITHLNLWFWIVYFIFLLVGFNFGGGE